MKKLFLKNNNQGFTLVELMVAVGVFSIVMTVAATALLNVIDANTKAQAIKTAINNVNLALEGISKDMRVGTDYACGDEGAEPSGDCLDGGDVVKYLSPKFLINDQRGYIWYRYVQPSGDEFGRIEQCIDKLSVGECSIGNGDFSPITSETINITNMRFYVTGVNDSLDPIGDRTQPRVVITLTGEAGTKDKLKTTFDLQTSVSQRARLLE